MGWMDLEESFFPEVEGEYEKKNAVDFLTELLEREKYPLSHLPDDESSKSIFEKAGTDRLM